MLGVQVAHPVHQATGALLQADPIDIALLPRPQGHVGGGGQGAVEGAQAGLGGVEQEGRVVAELLDAQPGCSKEGGGMVGMLLLLRLSGWWWGEARPAAGTGGSAFPGAAA
jgi:hypothetical protein